MPKPHVARGVRPEPKRARAVIAVDLLAELKRARSVADVDGLLVDLADHLPDQDRFEAIRRAWAAWYGARLYIAEGEKYGADVGRARFHEERFAARLRCSIDELLAAIVQGSPS